MKEWVRSIKLRLRGRLRFLRRSQKEEIERRKEGSVVCTYSDLRGRERTKRDLLLQEKQRKDERDSDRRGERV